MVLYRLHFRPAPSGLAGFGSQHSLNLLKRWDLVSRLTSQKRNIKGSDLLGPFTPAPDGKSGLFVRDGRTYLVSE
jgi:hypothetical protein